jgi:hypothetical protein
VSEMRAGPSLGREDFGDVADGLLVYDDQQEAVASFG